MIRLASSSPTRAKLLKKAGIDFIQSEVEFDEESLLDSFKNPLDFVKAAAKGKLDAAVKKYGLKIPIVVADSVVVADGEILRKAKDEREAFLMLKRQSGNKIEIVTYMIFKDEEEIEDLDKTLFIFDEFDEKDIKSYLKSGLWRGKAGACMVEGFCRRYIKKVIGEESTAMGLQVKKLKEIIKSKQI
jgi:septum formation protein